MTTAKPSSNWLVLQKSLVRNAHPRKRRKIGRCESSTSLSNHPPPSPPSRPRKRRGSDHNEGIDFETTEVRNGESIATLRRMILGKMEYKNPQTAPGKYLALDCEMVGVGIEGNESSLARVSIVNYTGAIILDVFVRQREKVVDYRTQWSGVRSTDLTDSAKSFKEVQQTVAGLIKDRILVGHAIYNDLKALLLSHPSPQIRDTQSLAYKYRVVRSRWPALRVLVKRELGVTIQGGEHSSVTDARATMALFRIHKKQWESGFRPSHNLAHPQPKNKPDDDSASKGRVDASSQSSSRLHPSLAQGGKRGHSGLSDSDDNTADEKDHPSSPSSSQVQPSAQHTSILHKRRKQGGSQPSANQKGISSGISVVTRRTGGIKEVAGKGLRKAIDSEKGNVIGNSWKGGDKKNKADEKWWRSLGGGKKGGIKP